MCKREDFLSSLDDEEKEYNEFLDKANLVNKFVPFAQERKREIQALKTFVESAPEEVIDELKPVLYPYQLESYTRIHSLVSRMPDERSYGGTINATSSTGSLVMSYTSQFAENHPDESWTCGVLSAFTLLAEEKSKKDSFPSKLDQINTGLGQAFSIAKENVEKARSGPDILNVNLAALSMRSVLEQLWGGLCKTARMNKPRETKGFDKLELKKQPHRQLVASSVIADPSIAGRLHLNLDTMKQLYSDLSDTNFGKNLLSKDLDKLNLLYTKWITIIDDVLKALVI